MNGNPTRAHGGSAISAVVSQQEGSWSTSWSEISMFVPVCVCTKTCKLRSIRFLFLRKSSAIFSRYVREAADMKQQLKKLKKDCRDLGRSSHGRPSKSPDLDVLGGQIDVKINQSTELCYCHAAEASHSHSLLVFT